MHHVPVSVGAPHHRYRDNPRYSRKRGIIKVPISASPAAGGHELEKSFKSMICVRCRFMQQKMGITYAYTRRRPQAGAFTGVIHAAFISIDISAVLLSIIPWVQIMRNKSQSFQNSVLLFKINSRGGMYWPCM